MILIRKLISDYIIAHTHVHGFWLKQVFQTNYLRFQQIVLRKFGLCLLDLDPIGFNT